MAGVGELSARHLAGKVGVPCPLQLAQHRNIRFTWFWPDHFAPTMVWSLR
ncbi:MAG: hypothetical protein L0K41_10665 [Yaniella sp.]|nr:hypothetical protein [Yaniella sp.]MDN6490847.1 hypothetical protein [Yaniella sp.]